MLFRRIPNFSVFSRLATSVVCLGLASLQLQDVASLQGKGHEKDCGWTMHSTRVRTPYTRH